MARLFLRAYLRLLVGLFLGALTFGQITKPIIDAKLRRNIEESLSSSVVFLAEELADAHQKSHAFPEEVLARAKGRMAVPIAVVPRSAVPLADQATLQRLDRGEVVGSWTGRVTGTFFARVGDTGFVIALGPVNVEHPVAGWRGITVIVLLLGTLVLGMYLALLPIQRRLARLARAADDFGDGRLDVRAEVGPPDAIGNLVTSFNRMAAELERLVGAHKELLRTVSHELRTPLQRLHFAGELVRASPDAADRELGLERMERDIEELEQLIEELLTYARLGDVSEATAPVDLRPVVHEIVESLGETGGRAAVAVRGTAADALLVSVEPRLQRRALSNLITNAMRHARSRVEVEAARDGASIRVDVDDDGPGVPEPDRARIFEPFYRVDDEITRGSRGFGLGLAIVRGIAERHGGKVEVLTSTLGGARFRISFPLAG